MRVCCHPLACLCARHCTLVLINYLNVQVSNIFELSMHCDLLYLQNFFTQQCHARLSADRQVGRPRVAFASAAAVAAIVEGRPAAAETVAEEDGLAPVVNMLSTAGGLGKKAAAECLQVIHAF